MPFSDAGICHCLQQKMKLNQRCVLALDYSSAQTLLCTSIFIWSFVNININNTNMFNEDICLQIGDMTEKQSRVLVSQRRSCSISCIFRMVGF